MAAEAVIFLPGIMGSVLMDGADVVWPGSASEIFLPYKKMAQLQMPGLTATDVIRQVSISAQYKIIIDSLGRCGFKESTNPPTLYVCPYDWRKDNALAADVLAVKVDQVAQDHGLGVKLYLVAHSMGGLVSRCYLESGRYGGRPGFGVVKALFTLGTPHRGAPAALQGAVGQLKRLFLSEAQVKTIANDPNFPSLYQLLPPTGEPFAWDEKADSRFSTIDIYDPGNAVKIGLSAANLAAAKNFHALLDLSRRLEGVRYFFFAGTRQPTVSEVRLRAMNDGSIRVRAEEREDAGDGTVPGWSAAPSGIQMAPVGGEHGDLYRDSSLKNILGVLLGKPGVLAAAAPAPELALKDSVVNPQYETRAVISFSTPVTNFQGELMIEKVADAAGAALPQPTLMSTDKVNYSGAGVDRLSLTVKAPAQRGLYLVRIVPAAATGLGSADDDLFVQET